MDHVIAPLDADHTRVVAALSVDLAAALCIPPNEAVPRPPHITIASYAGLELANAAAAVAPVLAALAPFTVRAHGYGIFTGDSDTDLSLHVMVVRTRALDVLHGSVHAALGDAGARLAGTTKPSVWSPHITLLDRGLTPRLLGQAVEVLARRPHRTWSIGLETLAVVRRPFRDEIPFRVLPLGRSTAPARLS
jgi:2'-5' RNA ligase superfamily